MACRVCFIRSVWGIVGDDVTNFCLNVLNRGSYVREVNQTMLTMIPKVDQPTLVTEFRPISLCTVLYKIVSKTLVNRLKHIMPFIISKF